MKPNRQKNATFIEFHDYFNTSVEQSQPIEKGGIRLFNTEKVVELMKKCGYNGQDLARAVEVDKSMISKILKGRKQPSLSLANEIAKALGCTIDELTRG